MTQEIFLTAVFFVFCIFFNENNIKQHHVNTFRKLRDRATIIVVWKNCPNKEGASPMRVNDTDRQHEITDAPQKWVYMPYLCLQLFVHMYLLPDSSSILIPVYNLVESTGIQSHSTGLHWSPLDSAGMIGVWQE